MLTLHTWMDANGFAFPSLRTWAAGSRMAIGTLRKHLNTAVAGGWLGVEVSQSTGKSWRRNTYRAAVPDSVTLTEKDELLATALCAQHGDIDEAVSTIDDTPTRLNGHGVSIHADTPDAPSKALLGEAREIPGARLVGASTNRANAEGVSNGAGKLCQSTPEGVSKNAEGVSNGPRRCVNQGDTEVLKSEVLEVLEQPSSEEGAALARNTPRVNSLNLMNSDAEAAEARKRTMQEERARRIRKALRELPDWSDDGIAKAAGATLPEVQQIRRHA